MKTKSAKSKGQRLSKYVKERFLKHLRFKNVVLLDEDVTVTPSGVAGSDVIIRHSDQNKRSLNVLKEFDIECKNTESLNIWKAFKQAQNRCIDKKPLIVFKRNRSEVYVSLKLDDFMKILDLL